MFEKRKSSAFEPLIQSSFTPSRKSITEEMRPVTSKIITTSKDHIKKLTPFKHVNNTEIIPGEESKIASQNETDVTSVPSTEIEMEEESEEKIIEISAMLNLGNPSDEWLANIEKIFHHFFLVMFDSKSEANKVKLEKPPMEPSEKVEETFRILYKMDKELHKDLDHVVYLSQNWIASQVIKVPAQQRAMQIINDYMETTKSEGYNLLPTYERMDNLKSFIHSLEQIGYPPRDKKKSAGTVKISALRSQNKMGTLRSQTKISTVASGKESPDARKSSNENQPGKQLEFIPNDKVSESDKSRALSLPPLALPFTKTIDPGETEGVHEFLLPQPVTSKEIITVASTDSWVTTPFDHVNDTEITLEEESKITSQNEIDITNVPSTDNEMEEESEEKGIEMSAMLSLGHPSDEWLANIEKLFLHFFLVMFDSESETSKVKLEMFPMESSENLEGAFRILYKMDKELYRDLEHVVYLAQNWIASQAIKGPAQQRAMQIINNYMETTRSEGYNLLPTDERKDNLKSFIHSLEQIGELPKRQISKHNIFRRDAYGVEFSEPVVIKRPISPRVKPGSHYARVVANILCDRPCTKPVSPPDVYADKLVKKYFRNPFLNEKEFQEFTDNVYGANYTRKDIFSQINPNLYRKKLNPARIDPMNRNCMLPIYTGAYLKKVKDGTCCPRKKRKSVDHPDGFTSPRGHFHKYKILSDSSEEWEHDFKTGMRTKRKPGYVQGKYGGYVVGVKNYYEEKRKRSKRNNGNLSETDYYLEKKDGKEERKKEDRRLRHIMSDPDSEVWEHDRRGKRTIRKADSVGIYYSSRKLRNIDSDPNSYGWEHDRFGNRTIRKIDRKAREYSRRRMRDFDDHNSGSWDNDHRQDRHNGKRSKRKPGDKNVTKYSDRKLRNIDSDSDSDAWEHDSRGERTKRRQNVDKYSYYGHKPHPRGSKSWGSGDSDGYANDERGNRRRVDPHNRYTSAGRMSPAHPSNRDRRHGRNASKKPQHHKHKQFEYPVHREHRIKDIKSDSDSDAWDHNDEGGRTRRKSGYRPRKSINSDSDSDAWIHDENHKRTRRVPGYKRRKSIASDSDSDAWEHDRRGKRIGRVPGYTPRRSIGSDSNSDNWQHDKQGNRTRKVSMHKNKRGKKGYGGIGKYDGIYSKPKYDDYARKGHHDMHNFHSDRHQHKHPHPGESKDEKKLLHLGDGDQMAVKTKADAKKSLINLPPLVLKPVVEEVQVKYKKRDHKRKPVTYRKLSQITDKLHNGGYPEESDDNLEENFLDFIPHFSDEDEEEYSSSSQGDAGIPDDAGDPGINTCWELSEILFKSPFNKTLIPAPENILSYIAQTMPKSKWPKGAPLATRKYPNGALFCTMYENGSGLVFYPHGGLAVVISAPRPYNRVLIIRDPLDGFFFMDKAIMAQLSTAGHGTVYDKNGVLNTQYNVLGGFHLDEDIDQSSKRWLWNNGGMRLILKLNKYIRINLSKLDKIGLVFNGNKRGFFVNVGAGRKVAVLKVEPTELIPPKGRPHLRNPEMPSHTETAATTGSLSTQAEVNEYFLDRKFSTPVLGFVDKEHDEA